MTALYTLIVFSKSSKRKAQVAQSGAFGLHRDSKSYFFHDIIFHSRSKTDRCSIAIRSSQMISLQDRICGILSIHGTQTAYVFNDQWHPRPMTVDQIGLRFFVPHETEGLIVKLPWNPLSTSRSEIWKDVVVSEEPSRTKRFLGEIPDTINPPVKLPSWSTCVVGDMKGPTSLKPLAVSTCCTPSTEPDASDDVWCIPVNSTMNVTCHLTHHPCRHDFARKGASTRDKWLLSKKRPETAS